MDVKDLESALNKAYPHTKYKFFVKEIEFQQFILATPEITIRIESMGDSDLPVWFRSSLSDFYTKFGNRVKQFDYDTQILGGMLWMKARTRLGS